MKNLLFIFAFLFSFVSYSQSLDYNNSFESINICTAIQGNNFASERAADSALDDILNVIGASKRFVLKECSNINNAVALTMNGVRYIMYDPEFMTSLSYGDEWSNKFILAHEVGHHINGHTVDVLAANSSNKVSLSTRRIQELESDEFAGFVLGRLGASLLDALSGVQSLSDKDDSYSTHPRRSRRIAAIKKGFKESGGYVDSSNLNISKGKTINSKYSNSRYAGVQYQSLDNYYKDAVYEGYVYVKTGEPFGYGNKYYENGDVYKGEMSGGKKNGYGVMNYAGMATYEGFFVDNWITGAGVITYLSGTKLIGNFVRGGLNGEGKKIWSDGDIDEGSYKNGNIISITRTYKDGTKLKVGFLDGSGGEGFGTYTYASGDKLEASFEDGTTKKSRGVFSFENGYSPSGYMSKKSKKLHKKAGKSGFFRGLWSYIPDNVRGDLDIILPKKIFNVGKNDAKNSVGQTIWNLTNMKSLKINYNDDAYNSTYNDFYNGYTYIGDFLCYGTYDWVDGRKYKGYFKSGTKKKAGYGELIYDDDYEWASYFGVWWDDEKNGYGVLTYKDGKVEKGIFRNNKFFKSKNFDLQIMQHLLKDF
jgi:hypothetical protein